MTQEIKKALENGEQFENQAADWYTLNRPEEKLRMIVINGENKFFKNMNSYSIRVSQLIKRGY